MRKTLTAWLISSGIVPAQLDQVFTGEMANSLQFVRVYGSFGGAGTRKGDAKDFMGRVIDRIRLKIGAGTGTPKFVTASIDGASTDFGGGHSVSALVIDSPTLPHPILLGTTWAGGTCDAAHYAEFFNDVRTRYGMSIDQFVALMGDCVTLNDKVARLLGITRLKCLSHIMALLCHSIYGAFPNLEDFLRGLHTLFTAGGSHKRKNEANDSTYVSLGMNVAAINQLCMTRWGTANELMTALTTNAATMLKKALPLFLKKANSVASFIVDADGERVLEDEDGVGLGAVATVAATSSAVRVELGVPADAPDAIVRGEAARMLRYLERQRRGGEAGGREGTRATPGRYGATTPGGGAPPAGIVGIQCYHDISGLLAIFGPTEPTLVCLNSVSCRRVAGPFIWRSSPPS
jgi:hypothetical protein